MHHNKGQLPQQELERKTGFDLHRLHQGSMTGFDSALPNQGMTSAGRDDLGGTL